MSSCSSVATISSPNQLGVPLLAGEVGEYPMASLSSGASAGGTGGSSAGTSSSLDRLSGASAATGASAGATLTFLPGVHAGCGAADN